MHVVIINGSPRVQKYSNTDKIIAAFAKGLSEKGNTFETYAISNRKTWDIIRDAYIKNDEILIALPLYVECVPGLLLEFLETLPEKDARTRLQLHGGYGYSREYEIERLYRDIRVCAIYEGSSQVQQIVISGQMLN